jgi:PAS domain S-box-containing protein
MQRNTGASFPMADAERYRILIEAISDYAIYLLDPKGNVASWNLGAQRIMGYQPSEIISKNFSVFYTPEDRAADFPQKALATAAKEGKFKSEGWRVRKDGSKFWTHVVIDTIRNPAGGLLGYAKTTRDLTERKHAEDALRSSEQQFKLLVEGVSDYAIYMLDTNGRVASWNTGAQRIKGYRRDEVIGKHF